MEADHTSPPLAESISRSLNLGDRAALEFQDRWYSWRWMAEICDEQNRLLGPDRSAPRTRVVFLIRNRPAHLAAFLGSLARRRVSVFINVFQPPALIAEDIRRICPAAVVADEEDWTSEDILAAVRETGAIGISLCANREAPIRLVAEAAGDAPPFAAEGIAIEMLTSGTTGAPKRIPLGFDMMARSIRDQSWMASCMGLPAPTDDLDASLVLYSPAVQMSGLNNVLHFATEGRRLFVLEKFTAGGWRKALLAGKLRWAALPPAMLRMVLDAGFPAEDFATLRSIRCGAAPLDDASQARFETAYGVPVLNTYGATEYGGPVTSWSVEDYRAFGSSKRGSVGKLWSHVAQGRVRDSGSNEILPAGETGVLELLIPRVSTEWIRTSDLASLDPDGFLYIQGRADDVIIRGGFKILPDVVVQVLLSHPKVRDAAVVGIPDERLGQVPVAAVELRTGAESLAPGELERFLRTQLAPYQVPAHVKVVDNLPRTSARKIQREGLRALFAGGR